MALWVSIGYKIGLYPSGRMSFDMVFPPFFKKGDRGRFYVSQET